MARGTDAGGLAAADLSAVSAAAVVAVLDRGGRAELAGKQPAQPGAVFEVHFDKLEAQAVRTRIADDRLRTDGAHPGSEL